MGTYVKNVDALIDKIAEVRTARATLEQLQELYFNNEADWLYGTAELDLIDMARELDIDVKPFIRKEKFV